MEKHFLYDDSNASNSLTGEAANDKKAGKLNSPFKAPFAVVEAYKNIRIRLMSILEKYPEKKIIAISSPNAAAGKSTTSVNLAITLSQIGKKVMLIDGDIRRATVDKKLRIENGLGCSDVLAGNCQFNEAVVNYNPNMDILTSGSVVSNPSDLLGSVEFDHLLNDLREIYDYIIIDTPPLNLVSDTLAISKKCDGVILVARVGLSTYAELKSALESLKILDICVLGAIINGVEDVKKKYKSYYGYK